jgi:hypothetical protein
VVPISLVWQIFEGIRILLRKLEHVLDCEALDLWHRGHQYLVPFDVLIIDNFLIVKSYLLVSPHYLLEEVHISGVQGWQVGLAVLEQEIEQLFLRLHLRADLVHIQALKVHLKDVILLAIGLLLGWTLILEIELLLIK